jgi:prephenate dehydrogenase
VAVVGLGLVGGSLARALTRGGWEVVGVDREPVRRRALRSGAISASAARLEQAARECDIVVLAAPPDANLRLLRRAAAVGARAAVTDVGSVKAPILREARRLGLKRFVGGHPMAGTERRGFATSSADLFRGRPWIVCEDGAPRPASALVRRMIRAAGARPVAMDARAHDRVMAFLSHVPQLVAWALLDAARSDPVAARHLHVAGPGFWSMTRLARSPRPLWREVLGQNEPEVARALRRFVRVLGRRRGARNPLAEDA